MSDNILKITFNASTNKGIIVNNQLYKPSMSNPNIYSQFPSILFIPSIKITNSLFDKGLGEDDIKKIFLSSTQLDNFLTRIREKGLYKPITISDAQTKGIIYNNIKFILELFFKKGDKFVINNTSYIINNYTWNNKYDLIPIAGKKSPTVSIKLDFFLQKGEKLSFTDSANLTCMQKKQSIVNEYYRLVGLDLKTSKTAPVSEIPVAIPISSPPTKLGPLTKRRYNARGGKNKKKGKTMKRYITRS